MSEKAETFRRQRPRLRAIAYRMLGSHSDADDMLQEAYLRWHKVDADSVQVPEAWLTTAITRLCIDRLRAVRSEREAYWGPWLPEPWIDDTAPPADHHAELASDLSVALLVVLEQLAPEERAAFLLHEAFDCDYSDIAQILGKNPANCRQIVHRARERVRRERPRFEVSEHAHRRLVDRFIHAMQTSDKDALLKLFADDATWIADGGGKVQAMSKPVVGGSRVAKLLHGVSRTFRRRYASEGMTFEPMSINGKTGVVMRINGNPFWALSLETDGLRILAGYNVVNPDKLSDLLPHR